MRSDRSNFVRVVRTACGEIVEQGARRIEGRGAYVCRNEACIGKTNARNLLSRAFRRNVKLELTGRADE